MSSRFVAAAVAAALAMFAAPSAAMAQDVVVDLTTDVQTDGECTSSPGDCTLRDAVEAVSSGGTILLPPGHYRLLGPGLNLATSMFIEGEDARTTTIDATGASRVGYVSGPADVVITGVTVTGGDAGEGGDDPDIGEGGAFRVGDNGELQLRRSAVVGNVASDNGGGIATAGQLTLVDSVVSGNSVESGGSPHGGGISISDGGDLSIFNSTVSGNTATDSDGTESRGGGIYAVDEFDLEHATIAANGADVGGGLHLANIVPTTFGLADTLIAGNVGGACAGVSDIDSNHSLDDDGTCDLDGTGDLPDADAGLAPLADYGGPTNTHGLFAGSQAIGGSVNCADADQRGVPRSIAPCDIGAFDGTLASVTTTTDDYDTGCDPLDCTLREALAFADNGTVIMVPAGDYQLTLGELSSTRDHTILGAGAGARIIADDGERVLSVSSNALVARNVRITGGEALSPGDPRGGGVLVGSEGGLELVDTTVDGNTAGSGGGIWVEGVLDLTRSTVSDNHAVGDPEAAGDGGGIGVDDDGAATLENVTVSGNTALHWGGGIYTRNDVSMRNVTIAQNQALGTPSFGAGGGIRQDFQTGDGDATVASNVLLAGNVGFSCGGTNGGVNGLEFMIQSVNGMSDDPVDTPSCNVNPATNTPVPDAGIGPLTSNGGPTLTHALLTGSPAIDAGNLTSCPATDQRGTIRPVGSSCDIGAFEGSVAPPSPPPPPPPPPPPAQQSQQELPPPVAGKSVNAETKSGTVKFKLPGSDRFVTLGEGEQIPVGTTIDATKGRVTLIAASNKTGGTATADFYDGIFRIGQTKGAKPITTLKLVEKLSCPKRGKASAAAKKKKRRLWGDGKGRFRTEGSYSSATVRGTRWLTQDTCTTTLTKVARGSVTVRDLVKKKTVIVRAPKQYVAKRKP